MPRSPISSLLILGKEHEALQCHFQKPSVLAHGKALQVLQPKARMGLPRRKLRGLGSYCCEVSHQRKWPAQKWTRLGGEVEAAPVVSPAPAARGSVQRSGCALKKKRAACVCFYVASAIGLALGRHCQETACSLGNSLQKALPEMALALARQLPSMCHRLREGSASNGANNSTLHARPCRLQERYGCAGNIGS